MSNDPDSSSRFQKQRLSPTLADVARAAGVSVSTAGRVLRNKGWPVNEDLRQRVLKEAQELAYVPNVMARSLRDGAPSMVGLVIGNMLDPYYGEIGETVTRYAEECTQTLVMVCNMQRSPQLELEYCRRLWEHRVAGIILAGGGFDQFTLHDELESLLLQMERSGVVVTTMSPRGLPFPVFSVDNEVVGEMAGRELVKNGHRKVGIIVGPMKNRVLHLRIAGISRVLEDAGIEYFVHQTGLGPSWVAPALTDMLAARPDISGVIAASSMMSINIIQAVEATGRRVPDDMSVIGIGGHALGDWAVPRLTRVDMALDVCGRAAQDYIARRIANEDVPPDFSCDPVLVPGGSIRNLNG